MSVDNETAASGHYSGTSDPTIWFRSHFDQAAGEIVEFFAGDGISLKGSRVADVGCGDGITDLGLAQQAEPARLVGFDIRPTDREHLLELARQAGVELPGDGLPANLDFITSGEVRLPAEDRSFDYVVSWSAFEHILEPVPLLREIRRILTDEGVLFIQLWPFYHSMHGTHLVDWFPEGFAQYRHDDEHILATMQADGDPALVAEMFQAYQTLNRITADELLASLRQAGFRVAKLALQTDAVHIPEQASHLAASQVGISGIKLLAVKAGEPAPPVGAAASTPVRAGRKGVRVARRLLQRTDSALARLETSRPGGSR